MSGTDDGPEATDLDELDPETRAFVLAGIERLRRRIADDDFTRDPAIGDKQRGFPGAVFLDDVEPEAPASTD